MYRAVSYRQSEITGGFWKQKQDLVRKETVGAVYDRFKETGRIDAFRFDWKPGKPLQPHYFWDSDVAKWMEGAAYVLQKKPSRSLQKKIDDLVDLIEKNQGDDGYFNIYFTVVDPANRLTNRDCHELYCAGHLIEAAVAYYQATGKRKFLDCMEKYVAYIDTRFRVNHDVPFMTPGHEEIELALVRLYDATGDRRYLTLASFFLDSRGVANEQVSGWMNPSYNQSHLPVREQTTAEGHSVRAMYLYCAMADVAARTNDQALLDACKAIFRDVTERKMYITGGIGSSSGGEAFTVPYDLPNLLAYTESCASLGLALFARRMSVLELDSSYADTAERVIYNGFMSSLSLDGKSFFYENPLEIMPYLASRDTSVKSPSVHWPQMTRSAVFSCSCCPPNIVRFIPSIADFLYTEDDTRVYVHQFMQSKTDLSRPGGRVQLSQKTRYPEDGKVTFTVTGGNLQLAIRIPWWVDDRHRDAILPGCIRRGGYVFTEIRDGEPLTVDFGMRTYFVESNPQSLFSVGKMALMRGPVVYCLEAGDSDTDVLRDITLDTGSKITRGVHPELGVPTLTLRAYCHSDTEGPLYRVGKQPRKEIRATFIPYYAFANRGTRAMQVWSFVK